MEPAQWLEDFRLHDYSPNFGTLGGGVYKFNSVDILHMTHTTRTTTKRLV
jgi:hypothetical protein